MNDVVPLLQPVESLPGHNQNDHDHIGDQAKGVPLAIILDVRYCDGVPRKLTLTLADRAPGGLSALAN